MDYTLDVKDIHTFIGQYHILQGVSVHVPKGSITALLGRNGAGTVPARPPRSNPFWD